MRIRGVGNTACSTGVALYAQSLRFVTTAAHCGSTGTWVTYDNGNVVGTVKSTNIRADTSIIQTLSFGYAYSGPWNTYNVLPIDRMERPKAGEDGETSTVVVSGGASGNGHYQYVESVGRYWLGEDGSTQGPGFHVEEYPGDPEGNGWVTQGDSGSPVIRTTTSGKILLQGFVSLGFWPVSTHARCSPYRHPSFPLDGGECYKEYYAVYADAAIAAFPGVHLQTS
jgi:secreted trypsin-like serine protease